RARNILVMTLCVGMLGSFFSLISPVATAYITSHIIPTANLPELWQISALLIVLLLCQSLIGVVPSLISMIFSARQFERFQAAVFDHILRIPVHVFKRCDAGDMTQRILGANQIQSTLFNLVSQQFLSSIFALSSLAMMFYYSPAMSMVGMGMVFLYAIGFSVLARFNLKPLAAHAAAAGRLSGLMKQFFDGVSKIRSAGAEQRVISRFMDDFAVTTSEEYKLATLSANQAIFTTAFPTIISLVFYAMAGGLMEQNLSFPIFLAFMAAFQNFQGGVMGLAGGLWTLQAIKPELDRIMPILEEAVEDDQGKHLPGQLDGDIEISQLNFRYSPDAPLVLKDVSLHAKAGEFIAIVGPSGAGKSSLVRLLLGFEQYESGGIYYSGKELAQLNLRAVRRQMGVILQHSKVMPSSILDNIATGTQCGEEDAFAALRLAAFEDEVRALPMGIHTMVNPSTISGGQQQRILIARALIGKPVAVIMDESTSALDNIAQQCIKNNMEQLKMTRIVIAHRLSTIINADRIYVLDQGRVVAQGTYQELLAQEGVFKDLVTRQQLAKNESI
ncbi:MAG: ATP-binding cassette domain-containing protein, partial [Akkermansia sp.]